jgi:tRNA-dihydrouridine synthase B
MAGVTDRPFRNLCRDFGAGLAVSEMVTSDQRLWNSRKSRQRLDHSGETAPRSVQIAGADPEMMASAAQANVENGAQIIDINMGCPAKKVCNKAAGSALLRDEKLVGNILEAVVNAVDVPVTLKIRTGWCPETRNALTVARIAEQCGIQALTIHGRTRACRYNGDAEYDTIAEVVQQSHIPVIANGDITSAEKASFVLKRTGAAAIMVGRAAHGAPWIFSEINHYLETGLALPKPTIGEVSQTVHLHIRTLHDFYGPFLGVRIARKHIGWYLDKLPQGPAQKKAFNQLQETEQQLDFINHYFQSLDPNLRLAA